MLVDRHCDRLDLLTRTVPRSSPAIESSADAVEIPARRSCRISSRCFPVGAHEVDFGTDVMIPSSDHDSANHERNGQATRSRVCSLEYPLSGNPFLNRRSRPETNGRVSCSRQAAGGQNAILTRSDLGALEQPISRLDGSTAATAMIEASAAILALVSLLIFAAHAVDAYRTT